MDSVACYSDAVAKLGLTVVLRHSGLPRQQHVPKTQSTSELTERTLTTNEPHESQGREHVTKSDGSERRRRHLSDQLNPVKPHHSKAANNLLVPSPRSFPSRSAPLLKDPFHFAAAPFPTSAVPPFIPTSSFVVRRSSFAVRRSSFVIEVRRPKFVVRRSSSKFADQSSFVVRSFVVRSSFVRSSFVRCWRAGCWVLGWWWAGLATPRPPRMNSILLNSGNLSNHFNANIISSTDTSTYFNIHIIPVYRYPISVGISAMLYIPLNWNPSPPQGGVIPRIPERGYI